MSESILADGQCSVDPSVMTRAGREGYRPQVPDNRWTIGAIRDSIVNFFRREERRPAGPIMDTDMVFVLGNRAISRSVVSGSNEAVYCGFERDEEEIVVIGERRERFNVEAHRDRTDARARHFVNGDMGENPNRRGDIPLPGIGRGANITFENEGFTLRIPSAGGDLQYENVPDRFSFEDTVGGITARTRERQEELAEQRTLEGGRRN